jgi:8-oxo-dGTP pyrophosphatase MutT (NUDIX family)
MKTFNQILKKSIEGIVEYNENTTFFYPEFKEMFYKDIRFTKTYPNFAAITDKKIYEPETEVVGSGVIVQESDGRIWIRKVANNWGGYIYSFAKGKLEPELSIQQNAIKETFEELGLVVTIEKWLIDIKGIKNIARYYLGRRIGGHPSFVADQEIQETDYIVLSDLHTAKRLLNKDKDKEILKLL